ncbi:MAG: UDP-3-O-(3-hydroxymyristoyl)glucosamine N-acyltransferase [Endozoicomonas sp. (ex Botrylloides leachii)]|nr:UDP-3-O-(3-hydroxymyristoyl)glucosamine N-acyltransferase [Endozoicomonas sp. (ex Botrylloides leachii)]
MKKTIYTLAELANYIGASLQGDGQKVITGLKTLQDAGVDDLSFLANPAYTRYLLVTQAGAVIISPDDAPSYEGNALVMDNPYLGYAKISHLFDPDKGVAEGIHQTAVISPSAVIDKTAAIGANVVIEADVVISAGVRIDAGVVVGHDSVLGKNTHLARNVTICHGVSIGQRVIIHAGSVVGSDGFGNARSGQHWNKIAQIGGVIIGDDVEIGSCTCIDRGALDNTVIMDGARIDNLIQIAHNVVIGKNTAIASCAGISGSTRIGHNCTIGGGAGFAGHLDIADNVHIAGMAMVTRSIDTPGAYASGTGFMDAKEWRKNAVRFRQLNAMAKRLEKLEKSL